MEEQNWKAKIKSFDKRRDIIIPGDAEETIRFATEQFIQIAQEAIKNSGFFTVALSGGSTPNAIYKKLSQAPYRETVDWTKVLCFWSDERTVPPNHADSNYFNAMKAGLGSLPLLPHHIFRMKGEGEIEENAKEYEVLIRENVPSLQFDLIMLGMGEDGHVASLFPRTHALHTKDRLVVANYVPQLNTWRLTMTFECIHMAKNISIYVTGSKKREMIVKVLFGDFEPDDYPAQRVGTPSHKALWILDKEASSLLVDLMEE